MNGAVDWHGVPTIRTRTGTWAAAILILVNQGLATVAFYGVRVNLVLFFTRVMGQKNVDAANNVSKWSGTVELFSLLGAFLSDSYWGRYKTCVIFQIIFLIGLISLSLSSYTFLLNPAGCGDNQTPCGSHSSFHVGLFYLSIYLIALGYGGYQPNIATFGADQFDGRDHKEGKSKAAFFSYFYLALNIGCLFSNTILGYFENEGMWTLGFWASTCFAIVSLVLFLIGTSKYRHFRPSGNTLSRFFQVGIAAARKRNAKMPPSGEGLYEIDENENSHMKTRKMLHTQGFKWLDKAAIITSKECVENNMDLGNHNSWRLCTITQVEEMKCILRLLPIWLCTILYSVVFTQTASLFVEQGAAMKTKLWSFHVPPASMSSFDIISVVIFIFIYRRVLDPLIASLKKRNSRPGLTELQRMGIGLVIAIMAMISAGVVEIFRLKHAKTDSCTGCDINSSSLSILWQIPQYMLIGVSEVFMYVAQLEFFNKEAPDGLKSFGSALCMTSTSLGNYVSNLIVAIVMKLSTIKNQHGWIPENLNKGHLDNFYFLLAACTMVDFVVFIVCAKWYKYVEFEENNRENYCKDCNDLKVQDIV